MTSNPLTKAELDQIVPTEMRYRHNPIGKVLYTEGVKYLADKGEALGPPGGAEPDAGERAEHVGGAHGRVG